MLNTFRASFSINKSSLKVDLCLVQIGSFIATTYSNIRGSCVLQCPDLCTLPHIQSYSACNQQHIGWISSSTTLPHRTYAQQIAHAAITGTYLSLRKIWHGKHISALRCSPTEKKAVDPRLVTRLLLQDSWLSLRSCDHQVRPPPPVTNCSIRSNLPPRHNGSKVTSKWHSSSRTRSISANWNK